MGTKTGGKLLALADPGSMGRNSYSELSVTREYGETVICAVNPGDSAQVPQPRSGGAEMRSIRFRLLGALALMMALQAPALAVPVAVPYTGQLNQAGSPYDGVLATVQAKIYPAPDGGAGAIWTSSVFEDVAVADGTMSLVLSGGTPSALDSALMSQSDLWLEIIIEGEALAPRQKILSVPFAVLAGDAQFLGGVPASDFLQVGDDIEVGDLDADALALSGTLQVGPTTDACVSGAAGTIRYYQGMLSFCDGTSWKTLLNSGNATVDWSQLTGIPSDFADGTDDEGPQYFAGTGLTASGSIFHIDDTYVQRRVTTTCTGGAIMKINQDGTATCINVGQVYTASANGGVALTGTSFGLLSTCAAGQILKYGAAGWTCQNDATISNFSELTGTATDAQIPDNITVNYANDSDKVDGYHYSPVWDSTDALTLGGQPASYYASQDQVDTLNDKLDNLAAATPSMQKAICNAAMPTQVCQRDVYMADTHMKLASSFSMLSGGEWVYYAPGNRCEYSGGIATPNPKLCGQDLMPSWMDTTDECGGFRQSTWDTRVWYAVAKSNQWDPNYNYTCPNGFVPMTTNQAKAIFNGPQAAGALVYQNQCGWSGTVWGGKNRRWFRTSDSKLNSGFYKDSTSYDGTSTSTTMSLQDFAGIICISTAAPGPLDWMLTEDSCNGWRQSTFDSRFYYAVARKNWYDPNINYQCPTGYHWATTAEAYSVFKTTNNEGVRVYQNMCGWNSYSALNDGLTRHHFRFADSFKDGTTLAHKHAGNADPYTVQFDIANGASSEYFAGIVCKADVDPAADPTDWMDKTDYCGGFRQSQWDPRFYFAVAKSGTWDKTYPYACPAGYVWATTADVQAAFTTSNSATHYNYYSTCGWNGYVWGASGLNRYFFRTANSAVDNWYMHAGDYEQYRGTTNSTTANFAGIICKKITDDPYPKPGTTDWMLTDDDCKGFRQSSWAPQIRYAVARQNVWNKTYPYQCPTGYHWASSAEYKAIMDNQPATGSFYRYSNQCGWSAQVWHGQTRTYFRFSDSATNNRYLHSESHETSAHATDGTLTSFAGIVCIQDNYVEGPLDWWDRSDNCGGFRQSFFDPDVYYMVSKSTLWNPNKVYTCPDGYHWMTTAEGDASFKTGLGNYNQGPYAYHDMCGWSAYVWRGRSRTYFRFSDSNVTGRYKHAGNYDAFLDSGADETITSFAGIMCKKNVSAGPLAWMDTSDNCGGWRVSLADPNIAYAIAKSTIWNPTYDYQCPTGWHWATAAEYAARKVANGNIVVSGQKAYHNQCGWSGYNWNVAWTWGCSSYGNTGCGSTSNAGTPTMSEWRLDKMLPSDQQNFAQGCTSCNTYHPSTTCNAQGTEEGADGKCGGIDEASWRNNRNINECYYSDDNFSGSPNGMVSGTASNHCPPGGGPCCGDSEWENYTKYREYLRVKGTTPTTATYLHTTSADGADLSVNNVGTGYGPAGGNESTSVRYFAGIICIKD